MSKGRWGEISAPCELFHSTGARKNVGEPDCTTLPDCQRLQQEQAPEQWEGRMGGRNRGGRWGGVGG